MKKFSIFKFQVLDSLGFTLVETLIVLAIIGLLSGIALSLYAGLNQSRGLQKGHDDLAQMLAQAKSYAQSQVTVCSGSTPYLYGYSVIPNTSTNCYSLNQICATDTKGSGQAPFVISTSCLPSTVVFSSGAQSTIVFPIQNGAITSGSLKINVKNFSSQSKTIMVSSNGAIQ